MKTVRHLILMFQKLELNIKLTLHNENMGKTSEQQQSAEDFIFLFYFLGLFFPWLFIIILLILGHANQVRLTRIPRVNHQTKCQQQSLPKELVPCGPSETIT